MMELLLQHGAKVGGAGVAGAKAWAGELLQNSNRLMGL